jgi:hypothetical protein
MRKSSAAAAVVLAILGAQVLSSQSSDLPPGRAQAKVRTSCTECHDSSIIVQQRLSKKAWTKELDKMIKWGALVDPTDHDAFVDYLTTNFPPEKPPESMPKVAAPKKQ